MIERRECAQCSRMFPRNRNLSNAQWESRLYCSRPCFFKAQNGRPFLSRLFATIQIDPVTRCWIWTGSRDTGGYGLVNQDPTNRNKKVHRVVYETAIGEIPEGHHVLHRCDVPACCNPFHLFTGTRQDNVDDRELKGRNNPRPAVAACTRLTEAEVLQIREDPRTQDEIARSFGIAQTTVSAIKTRRNWSHV